MRWSVGDSVMAKWPGSSLYFHAKIQSIDEDEAKVLFEDGTSMEIPIKSISSENLFTPRKRSKSPARSRRRSKSPARSPSRKGKVSQKVGKSPSQRSRSSSRGRTTTVLTTSYSNTDKKKAVISSFEDVIATTTSVESITVTKTTMDLDEKPSTDPHHNMLTRQRKKITQITSDVENELTKYNDERKSAKHGAVLGAFLVYITAPIFTLWLLLVAEKADWSITKFKSSMISRDVKSYLNRDVFISLIFFLLFHALLYALPLGSIMKGPLMSNGKRLEYRISGRYALIASAIVYGEMCYYKVNTSFIHDHIFHFALASTLIAFLANTTCYVISFYLPSDQVNPVARTGSFIYDSFMGRILHPRIGRLFDLKFYLYRPAMVGWMALIWIEIQREYLKNDGKFSNQFLLVAGSQIIYVIMEYFYDERQCPYMFDIKDEGLGFVALLGELVIVPFFYSLPIRYVIAHPGTFNNTQIVAISLLFLVGMMIVSLSGIQKSRFKIDPYDSNIAYLDSLPPSKVDGERLLVSGWWGMLRHPNYFGEIVIGISWSLACGFKHAIVWIYPVYLIGLLLHRALRLEEYSARKHGLAWKKYCDRVRYRVIPGVF